MHCTVVCQSPIAGGAERYLNLLYAELQKTGNTASLVGDLPGWSFDKTIAPLGAKWSGRSTLKGLLRLPQERRRIRKIVSTMETDVFHVQFKREQIGLTDVLAEYAPVVWTEHGRFKRGFEGSLLGAGYRQAARRAAAIICVSEPVAEDVRRIVGPRVRVEVLPNAVDTRAVVLPTREQRAESRAIFDLPADVPVVAWVGQTHAGKQPLLAARTAHFFDGIMLMAGRGSLENEVREYSDGHRLRYLGYVAEPSHVYRAADAFLFTSSGDGEGLPYSLLEAAGHGLPLVANRGSGMEGVVAEAGGLVAEPIPMEIANAIRSAVASSSAMSAASRRWAESHDVRIWRRQHEELFKEVSGSSQR